MHGVDEAILRNIADMRTAVLNKFMLDVSSLGSTTVAIIVMGSAFVVLWMARNHLAAVRILTATGGAIVWTEIAKRLFGRPRPAIVPYLTDFTGFSFPSGHTLTATATYATLAAIACCYLAERSRRSAVWLICWIVVTAVAVSRVYLGVHYPTDVAGGVLFGIVWFYLVAFAFRRSAPTSSQNLRTSARD